MWRLTTEFEHTFHGVQRCCLLDQDTHFIRTREADEVDIRVFGQGCPGFFSQPADDVQSAWGKTHFQGQFGNAKTAQAGIFGGLHHHRIAHGQCRSDAASHHLGRVIPRNDVCGDTQGFTQ